MESLKKRSGILLKNDTPSDEELDIFCPHFLP